MKHDTVDKPIARAKSSTVPWYATLAHCAAVRNSTSAPSARAVYTPVFQAVLPDCCMGVSKIPCRIGVYPPSILPSCFHRHSSNLFAAPINSCRSNRSIRSNSDGVTPATMHARAIPLPLAWTKPVYPLLARFHVFICRSQQRVYSHNQPIRAIPFMKFSPKPHIIVVGNRHFC